MVCILCPFNTGKLYKWYSIYYFKREIFWAAKSNLSGGYKSMSYRDCHGLMDAIPVDSNCVLNR